MAHTLLIVNTMFRPSQTALQRYKVRRGFPVVPPRHTTNWYLLGLLALAPVALSLFLRNQAVPAPSSVNLTYELDLTRVAERRLGITMIIRGDLPGSVTLELPRGTLGEAGAGVRITGLKAQSLSRPGEKTRELAVERVPRGWRLATHGSQRIGVSYSVVVKNPSGRETDIRKYITAPVNGGIRAAGYEIFLQPQDMTAGSLTLAVHNPADLPFVAPWPALVYRGDDRPPRPDLVSRADLAPGMGYLPATAGPSARPAPASPRAAVPVPANLLFHPRDLEDMNNSLLVCGNLATAVTSARGTIIQLATDRRWLFTLAQARNLVARIARTEIAFFGSSPTPQITVMLAANRVTASGRFDAYGLHTGSSVLVMLDEGTTSAQLRENTASVIAHEMFHGWLGEAIPQIDPQTLWFTEGATTWFAARMLTAGGVWTPSHARQVLRDRLTRNYAGSSLLGRMSVAEAASRVMADPDQVRFAYAGGVASCMALDRWLAAESGLMRPLDQVLRVLYDRHRGRPLSRRNLEQVIREVTGIDCAVWLDEHVYGTAVLPPLEQLL